MVKALISGYYGFNNFGDEGILDVLTKHLKGLNIETTVLSANPNHTSQKYRVNSVKSFDIKNVVKEIRNTDILISGGGSLLQDVTSLKSLVYYSFIIAFALLFGKKVVIFAQGIGPIKSNFAKFIVKNLLKQCSLVTVRDENSLRLLNEWKVESKQVCDPIYSMQIPTFQKENAIGIQLRNFKTMNDNLLQKLGMLINTKFSDKEIRIFSFQDSLDLGICKRFENILKSFNPQIQTKIITDELATNIAKLEYLFAMRYHAILVGIKSGVKTCAINYDIKVKKIAKDSGLPVISMDFHENPEDIYQSLLNINKDELTKFANSQKFDWQEFDKLFL